MLKKMSATILALLLFVSFSLISFAQESSKKEMKDEKTAMTRSDKEMGPVKSVSCGAECGFTVKSRNEKELVSIVKDHVKKMHQKKVSDKDVQAMMKTEENSGSK